MNRILIIGILLLIQVGCDSSGSKLAEKENQSQEDYTFLKYNFYQDKEGNLFEKKYVAIESIEEVREHFYDSMMFLSEYPNRIALNKVVDIESFQVFEETPFSRDKKHIYYVQASSDGYKRWVVEKADPITFSPLEYRWGRDNKNIFWQTGIVERADLVTFQVNKTNSDSASDGNSKYLRGQKLK